MRLLTQSSERKIDAEYAQNLHWWGLVPKVRGMVLLAVAQKNV
jgi:hypothetical protein